MSGESCKTGLTGPTGADKEEVLEKVWQDARGNEVSFLPAAGYKAAVPAGVSLWKAEVAIQKETIVGKA